MHSRGILPLLNLAYFASLETTSMSTAAESPSIPQLSEAKQPNSDIPKGRNASGRSWKAKPQKRASSIIVAKKHSHRTTKTTQVNRHEIRLAEKRQRKETAELQASLLEERRNAAILKKERRLENETRRAENEYKALQKSVQTLNYDKAALKLKAMSKKQLRQIKKTRVNTKTGVVEYVPAYQK